MYHLEFRIVLFLLLGVCLLSIILSQGEVHQIKQSTLEMQIPDISIRLFYWGDIFVNPDNSLLPFAENSRFVYSMQSFIRWCCILGVCTTSFNNGKMELFEGVGAGTCFFLSCYELHGCLAVVLADRKFLIQIISSFWWSFNIISHRIFLRNVNNG